MNRKGILIFIAAIAWVVLAVVGAIKLDESQVSAFKEACEREGGVVARGVCHRKDAVIFPKRPETK